MPVVPCLPLSLHEIAFHRTFHVYRDRICRRGVLQAAFSVLMAGCAVMCLKREKRGLWGSLVVMAVYFAATAPWCFRNYVTSKHYAMSASFGVQAFTKAFTFNCSNNDGYYFKRIKTTVMNCSNDLGISSSRIPEIPENDWMVNRLPHALMDSLTMRRGYSFFDANDL